MKYQAPKGTRDFYPPDMAWRNYLLDAWRRISIRNGFEQVDGPIFESLDLYKVKSGEGIVSELFHFQDRGERELAIRPEFTPTLARMVAAQANALPKPIKWFCTPNFCRAERPQRGRTREFWQWNVDILGTDPAQSAAADAEVIFTAVDLLGELGLGPEQVKVRISHRATVRHILGKIGVSDEKMLNAFDLLDRRDKMMPEEFTQAATALGLDEPRVQRFEETCRRKYAAGDLAHMKRSIGMNGQLDELETLDKQLGEFGIAAWCEYDLGIVRGLAYYTGTVFEVHETSGAMRAVAGGGRYDQLIQLFGGPNMPAAGFGMGDVVITDVLRDKGLFPENLAAKPDVFVIALTDAGAAKLTGVVAGLRRQGIHARFSYKATRNVGKLLKDATTVGARFAVILDDKIAEGVVESKNLTSGEQTQIPVGEVAARVRG
jgi:histidyl-tRNA synthetase